MSVQLDSNSYIPTQREEIKIEINKILDDFMVPLVEMTIVAEIKRISFAANIPKGFIDGVKFRKTRPNHGQVINTWGTEKKPLAKWFNYGTVMHWIEPKEEGGVLAWPSGGGGGKHASAIFFQGESKKGDMMFSKGHYISGIVTTHAMEIGFNIGKKQLILEAGKIVQKELKFKASSLQ